MFFKLCATDSGSFDSLYLDLRTSFAYVLHFTGVFSVWGCLHIGTLMKAADVAVGSRLGTVRIGIRLRKRAHTAYNLQVESMGFAPPRASRCAHS